MRSTIAVLPFLLIPLLPGQEPPAGWTATAPLGDARHNSCAARLADGRILISGGTGVAGDLNSAELYLPEGSFVPAGRMNAARAQHTCTLLNDGRVLVAGGDAGGSGELYEPISGTWQLVIGSGQARAGHTATLLGDGRVLLAGGESTDGPLGSLEIYDPQTNKLARVEAALTARAQHAAALLGDGRVLIAGGRGVEGPLASTELFNPADATLAAGPTLASSREGHSATALDDQRVLVAGGSDGAKELDTAEIYDPESGQFAALEAKLQTARRGHLALVIPGNGGVLMAGGLLKGQPLAATELFLPIENRFVALGALTAPRSGLAGAAVSEGVILAAGGLNQNGPQSACGLLLAPAIQFARSKYRPEETMEASGVNFRPNTEVTLSLDFFRGTSGTSAKSRLLTSSVTTPGDGRLLLFAGFGPVRIVDTRQADAGTTARLTAQTAAGVSAVASVPIKVATSISLTLPEPIYEGFNATFLAQLTRPSNFFPMTGRFSLGVAPTADGTSNTIVVGEAGTSTTVDVNTTGTSLTLTRQVTGVTTGLQTVTAAYSGDSVNDASSANAPFHAVTKTPVLQLSADPASPQVGVPFSLVADVRAQAAQPVHLPNGTVTFSQSGFALGSNVVKVSSTTNEMHASASRPFTALTLNPLSITAQYSGDGFFRDAASSPMNVTLQRAVPTLRIDNPGGMFQCNQPSTFNLSLTFPATLGLANRTVSVSLGPQTPPVIADGSSRTVLPGAALTPSSTVPGMATATYTALLPVDTTSVTASFAGDGLFAPVSSTVPISMARAPATVQLLSLPSTVTNPLTLSARVTPASCSASLGGTIEFLDGTSSLGVVHVAGLIPIDRSTTPIANASLVVSRPVGLHNLQARYSGDAHYTPASSVVVPVVFQ